MSNTWAEIPLDNTDNGPGLATYSNIVIYEKGEELLVVMGL